MGWAQLRRRTKSKRTVPGAGRAFSNPADVTANERSDWLSRRAQEGWVDAYLRMEEEEDARLVGAASGLSMLLQLRGLLLKMDCWLSIVHIYIKGPVRLRVARCAIGELARFWRVFGEFLVFCLNGLLMPMLASSSLEGSNPASECISGCVAQYYGMLHERRPVALEMQARGAWLPMTLLFPVGQTVESPAVVPKFRVTVHYDIFSRSKRLLVLLMVHQIFIGWHIGCLRGVSPPLQLRTHALQACVPRIR